MKKGLVIFLILIILGLAGYIVYDKVMVKETNEPIKEEKKVEKEITYTYEDMKGLYTFTGDPVYSEGAEGNITPTYNLYLYENGTFNYQYTGVATPQGMVGNYIIEGDKIILNYLYTTGSDVSLTRTTETKTLVIGKDNTLTDNNQPLSLVSSKSINLEKASESAENEFVENTPSFDKMLNEYPVFNNSNE